MQATNLGNSIAAAVKAPHGDFTKYADYDSTDNVIFQNLLKDPTVRDNIVENEDGTYSFVAGKGPWSFAESMASSLIREQNGHVYSDNAMTYTVSELAMFRSMTGYNLIQAGGGFKVADDYGQPVPEVDAERARVAWDLFDMARGIKDLSEPDVEITLADLSATAKMMIDNPGISPTDRLHYEALLELVGKLSEAGGIVEPFLTDMAQINLDEDKLVEWDWLLDSTAGAEATGPDSTVTPPPAY